MQNQNLPIKGWNKKDQTSFWNQFKRKRAHQLHFAKEVAGKLFFNQQEEIGIQLLSYFVEDYENNKTEILKKKKYPSHYKDDIIKICLRIGVYYEKSNDLAKPAYQGYAGSAEKYYLKGEAIYQADEDDPNLTFKKAYEGYLSLAALYLKKKESLKAKTVLQRMEASNKRIASYGTFMQLYRELACQINDFSTSDRIHQNIVKPLFEELKKEDYKNSLDEISNDLEIAAEAIIVYHHTVCEEIYRKDKIALERLDFLLKNEMDSEDGSFHIGHYRLEFLNQRLIPELGAYIGEVLIKEWNGTWVKAEKLMQSKVRIRELEFNPFQYAYKVVYFGHRLVEEVYNLVQAKVK